MAEKREPRHKRLYKETPELKRGEDGHMAPHKKEASKGQKEADTVESGDEGIPVHIRHANERSAMKHRHVSEHMAMHHKHQGEHAAHDHHTPGHPKSEMHLRHETELKEMHSHHEKESKAMHTRHESEITSGEHKDNAVKEAKPANKEKTEE